MYFCNEKDFQTVEYVFYWQEKNVAPLPIEVEVYYCVYTISNLKQTILD